MVRKNKFRLLLFASLTGAVAPLAIPIGTTSAQSAEQTTIEQTTTETPVIEDQGNNLVAELPVHIAPDNERLYYSGRFDVSNPAIAKCSWPASAVTLRFSGSAINASLGLGENRFTVVLDGLPVKRLTGKIGDSKIAPEARSYGLASALRPGEHTLTLFKNTETNVGDASFFGFQLPVDAVALPIPAFKRKIEVIGDSISAGYGIEGANQKEHFKPATENAYETYGAVAARTVGADYTCIAWSGRTMWPTFTIPEIYDRVLPRSEVPIWKGDTTAPDVYLINLATNEFDGPANPDEDGWVKAYHDFLARLRRTAPQATIYCSLGPMLSDGWPPQRKERSAARSYLERVVRESNATGDARVHFLEFEEQNIEVNGAGAAWHPSVKTNGIMATKFISALHADLGW